MFASTANALGYLAAAVAMIAPIDFAIRYRWIVRIGLIGYAATTIIGWAIQGPYDSTPTSPGDQGGPVHVTRTASTLALGALALALAACGGAAASPTPAPSVDPNALRISANGLKFDTQTLTAPADKQFQIAFDNKEGAPHNVAIYKDPNFSQQVFAEAPFAGPRLVTYTVPPLSAGSYVFVCDVHRDMKGTLTVQ